MTPKSKPGSGKGKGNKNALKHGLYAKTPLAAGPGLTIEERRAVLDACIQRMADHFTSLDDMDKMSKCLNSISIAVTAANNCDRTLAIINGNYTPLEDVLNELRILDPEED